jgi:hypothetical protein
MKLSLSTIRSAAAVAALAVSLGIVNVATLQAQRGQGTMHGHPPSNVPASGKPSDTGHGHHESDEGHGSQGKPTVGDLLTRNTNLAAQLQKLLPGVDLKTAASGFKNLGQFVAAAHVSHNLDISFDALKAKMTGSNAESLGKAIHELKPDVNSEKTADEATQEAKEQIKQTSAQTQTASK